jgi:hypothetical protein
MNKPRPLQTPSRHPNSAHLARLSPLGVFERAENAFPAFSKVDAVKRLAHPFCSNGDPVIARVSEVAGRGD